MIKKFIPMAIAAAIICCLLFSACSVNGVDETDPDGMNDGPSDKCFTLCLISDNEGTKTETPVMEGSIIEEPPHERKAHYDFIGWYTPEGKAEFPMTVESDITLTAVYIKIIYDIFYELNGGTNAEENPLTYDIDYPVVELAPASRSCFEFGGWYDKDGNKRTSVDIYSDGEITLFAEWINESHTYGTDHLCIKCGKSYGESEHEYENDVCSVCGYKRQYYNCTFIDGLNGETVYSYRCAEDSEVEPPAPPEHAHYTFKGWFLNDGTLVDESFIPSSNTTVTAIYDTVRYKIEYVLNGGINAYNPDDYDITTVLLISDPSKKCYKFGGWYLDERLTLPFSAPEADELRDITLYASWIEPSHEFGYDHICRVCGESTDSDHVYDSSHVCTVCGKEYETTEHAYDSSHVCVICGKSYETAEHAYDSSHVCTICGEEYGTKEHEYDSSHVCVICGKSYETAEHIYDTAHVCTVCGMPHENKGHIYGEDHLCEICNAAHSSHSYGYDHICTVCGEVTDARHVYDENGNCIVCGGTDPLFGIWQGGTASGFSSGSGSENDPYIIANGEELAYLAKIVNNGNNCENEYFALGADIDLGGAEWTPIGYGYGITGAYEYDHAFGGHFDGRGHTVSNMTISSVTCRTSSLISGIYGSVGLFGAVCGKGIYGASIRDVFLENVNITISENVASSVLSVGCLAGFMSSASVNGCFAEGNVIVNTVGSAFAGGVYGYVCDSNMYNETVNSGFKGDLHVNADRTAYAAGIVGYGYCVSVENCLVEAVIDCYSSKAYTNGLFYDVNAKGKASNAVFIGKIETSSNAVCDLAVSGSLTYRIQYCYISAELYKDGVFGGNTSEYAVSLNKTSAEETVADWSGWEVTEKGVRPVALIVQAITLKP